jgi:hypothetical protein
VRELSDERAVEAMGDGPTLTEGDQDALEAIRRQLDMEFPHSSEQVEERRSSNRARRAGTVVGTLLACAAGSAVGVLVTTLDPRDTVSPAIDREATRSTPATVTPPPVPRRLPLATPKPPIASRLDSIAEPRSVPRTTSTRSPSVAASAGSGPASVPATVPASPPTTPPLALDPPVRDNPTTDEPSPLAQITAEQLRDDGEGVKAAVARPPDDVPQRPRFVPEAP